MVVGIHFRFQNRDFILTGFLLLLVGSIFGEGFYQNSGTETRNYSVFASHTFRRMAGSSISAGTDTAVFQDDTVHRSSSNNWRIIPSTADDHKTLLSSRDAWSKSQYQDSLKLYDQLTSCTDSYVDPGIKVALNALDHAYRLYGPNSVICSFNGGKDAVVILHLVRAAHAKYYKDKIEAEGHGDGDKSLFIVRPRVVYFNHPDEFPEVTNFLHQSVQDYDLDMVAFEEGVKFQEGLQILVDNNFLPGCSQPFPMAFVLGTRSSDPNAVGQDHFAPSSHWMPPFMRVNPVLNWNYGHVWHFLRLFQLPYCNLYDQGYTSLGTTKDTLPCPALAVTRSSSTEDEASSLPKYWPAYMLRDWEQERAGRIKKEKSSKGKKEESSTSSSGSGASIGAQLETRTVIADESTTIETTSINDGRGAMEKLGDDQKSNLSDDSYVCPDSQKSVGILIIGDEILKGMTLDQNTNVAAKALRKECVKLSKVVVVSDDQNEIVNSIQRLQDEVDVIITSGGVGPTHDDVTIKSVAAALDRPLILNKEMQDLLKEKMNNGTEFPLTPAQTKMATLPSNSKLRYLSKYVKDDWPVLQCRNIFILPGVPQFFSKKIQNVAAYLSSELERGAAYKIVLQVDEGAIVDTLNTAVAKHANVTFGSYPFVDHPEYKTVLTLEGNLRETLQLAETRDVNSKLQNSDIGDGSNDIALISKETRDQYVRVALDDLLQKLPKDSILRVENDDLTPFT